jgi:phenylacetate-CoA ligase
MMRDHGWHGRDLSGTLCAISPRASAKREYPDWGPPATLFARTGRAVVLPIAADAGELLDGVVGAGATTLIARPATLLALATLVEERRRPARLQHIISIGETLSSSARATVEAAFRVRIADCYSSEEFGQIALQCPESGSYHVMSESVLTEVLNDRGEPCAPGETGRVVLTGLHNYATPLVRYAIGDMVEVAPPCPCGRGLPSWRRIAGRERNLIAMPDGRRHWPLTGFIACRTVAPVIQFQFVQQTLTSIEARLVVERPLSANEEDRLRELFCTWSGYPFEMGFTYFEKDIPVGSSGKREDFVSRL